MKVSGDEVIVDLRIRVYPGGSHVQAVVVSGGNHGVIVVSASGAGLHPTNRTVAALVGQGITDFMLGLEFS